MIDPLISYVIAIVFIATLIRSALGFGEALVAVPLLALRIPIATAAPLAVLISVVVAFGIVIQDWRRVRVRSASGLFLSSLPGIPVGILLLTRGDEHVIKLLLGILIVGFSVYSLLATKPRQLSQDHHGWMVSCGFLSGVLGGAYGMNGPPLAIYGSLRGWSPQHFRATLQAYFLPASLIGLAGYAAVGLWNGALTRYFLLSLPGVAVAILLGRAINQRMSKGFFRYVYVGLIAIGTVLVVQALSR